MYHRILVPLENSRLRRRASSTHVAELARLPASSVVLIHVADGWAARNHRAADAARERRRCATTASYIERAPRRARSRWHRGGSGARRRRSRHRDRRRGGARGVRPHRHEHARAQGRAGPAARQRGQRGAAPHDGAGAAWCAAALPRRVEAARDGERPLPADPRRSRRRSRTTSRRSTSSSATRTPAATNDIAAAARHRAGVGERDGAPARRPGADRVRAYRGVRLTDDGRRAALRTLRRHRIIECYLTRGARLSVGSRARRGRAAGARGVGGADRADGGRARRAGARSARRAHPDARGRRRRDDASHARGRRRGRECARARR